LTFSPDGQTLAAVVTGQAVKLWNVGSGRGRATPTDPQGEIYAGAFFPADNTPASGKAGGRGRVWDVDTLKEGPTFRGPWSGETLALAVSPDGQTVATGEADSRVRLWDVPGARLHSVLRGHRISVQSLAFSPAGKLLASGDARGQLVLWDPGTGRPVAALGGPANSLVYGLAFSADGKFLAAACGAVDQSGEIKVFDVASRQEWASFRGHSDSVSAVAFAPSGLVLASGSRDRTAKLWDFQPPAAEAAS